MRLHFMRLELEKLAQPLEQQEEQPEPTAPGQQMPPHPLWTAAKSIGAFGAGTAAGLGTVHGANALSKYLTAKPGVPGRPLISGSAAGAAIPITAGIGTMLFQAWQSGLMDQLRSDIEERRRLSGG